MRLFELQRDVDVSGASGTGRVAQGVVFDDGRVAFRWLTPTRSTVTFDSIEDMEKIHGHDGKTKVVWVSMTWPKEPSEPQGELTLVRAGGSFSMATPTPREALVNPLIGKAFP